MRVNPLVIDDFNVKQRPTSLRAMTASGQSRKSAEVVGMSVVEGEADEISTKTDIGLRMSEAWAVAGREKTRRRGTLRHLELQFPE